MRIAYYMPFKPLGHHHPSGDLVTGTEIYRFLQNRGHTIGMVSRFRARWIYLTPWRWPRYLFELLRALRRCRRMGADAWLTYHSYYKAPDIVGPICSRLAGIPYIIFQGIYATKRRRSLKTWIGFHLNRHALMAADRVITNKKKDYINLQRIIPAHRLAYVGPGIVCQDFTFDPAARRQIREDWAFGDLPVIICAAMFRPGVKARGVERVIRACGHLDRRGVTLRLVLVGDGDRRRRLTALAGDLLPERVVFTGRVDRRELYRYFSAADLLAFPGIEESLGMVYLEAQSCGLPVVAYGDWGASEAIVHGVTGLLSAASDKAAFEENIRYLVEHADVRKSMGLAAAAHIRQHHDLDVNYRTMENLLVRLNPCSPGQHREVRGLGGESNCE